MSRQGLTLKVNAADSTRILIEIWVDDKPQWSIAANDERPDIKTDPIMCVYTEEDDEPQAILHYKPYKEVTE